MLEEPPLDPAIAICDPHHHLWDYPGSRYLIDELRADGAGFNVTSTVFVECASAYRTDGPVEHRPVGETEWVAQLAGDSRYAAGIIGFADLTVGAAIADVLAAHVEAGQGRFRGIRHASAWDADDRIRASHTNPPPELLLRPDFRAGYAELGRAGLQFEAWLYWTQLPELIDLARAFPDIPVVLDHLGGPIAIGPYEGRRDELLETWRASMREVAVLANVTLKLGGIGMPIYGMDWHHRDETPGSEEVARVWGPEVRWCIEQFGADRCMFESNFPVDRRSFSYSVCWNSFLRIAADCSDAERAALFHDNAVRIYRLSE